MGNLQQTLALSPIEKKTTLGDFYWQYADILRGIGVPPATYDQRIMAFMAVKLLIDNDKLAFNFRYNNQFGMSDDLYLTYKGADTKATFKNIVANMGKLGKNLRFFQQEARYNPGEQEHILAYVNHPKIFTLDAYIDELSNEYLEMVLDIYTFQADFTDYPKEQYKDLYELTISRMKKLVGDLTGQHFTQKSIIHLMCAMAWKQIKEQKSKTIAIYDPASGTGSMIMEAAHYFHAKNKKTKIQVFGQEIHAQTWLLSKIFLEISVLDGETQGIENIIAFGNTLTAPQFSQGINGKDSFDFIIANPPFGVDWKHDYDKIIANMASKEPNFMVVKDGKNYVTPKKSDGQFLFMQHIIKLMQREKNNGKRAFAALISSSTLLSTGSKTGSEAKIRHHIFNLSILKAVVEQPDDMFTNTNIGSHIWFLDTEGGDSVKLLRAENAEKPLFSPHPAPKDKMKNAYSDKNIQSIIGFLSKPEDKPFVSKTVETKGRFDISINNIIGKKIPPMNYDLDDLERQINELVKQLQMEEYDV